MKGAFLVVTIRDVARHAAVSPTTVSQVLRNGQAVRLGTRQRVEKAISELGYRHRGVGRPSTRSRHLQIGIAYRDAFTRPMRQSGAPWRWFDAVQHELQSRGYHVSFFGGPTDGHTDPLFREMVRQGRIQGAVFIGGADREQDVAWASQQQIPTLVIHRRPSNREFSYVDIDNDGGARQAVDYLVQHGHGRIGMIHRNPVIKGHHAVDRQRGFHQAMAAHRLKPVVVSELGSADLKTLCQQAVSARPTALFCDSDSVASQVGTQLHRMGIEVPGQISLIGFDDAGIELPSGLRVTSISIDSQLVGRVAIDMLQQLIRTREQILNLSTTVRTRVAEHDTVRTIGKSTSTG